MRDYFACQQKVGSDENEGVHHTIAIVVAIVVAIVAIASMSLSHYEPKSCDFITPTSSFQLLFPLLVLVNEKEKLPFSLEYTHTYPQTNTYILYM